MHPILDALDRPAELQTDACRLFHGRGHCFEGLEHINIDRLGPVLLISLYQETDAGLLAAIVERGARVAGVAGVLVQHRYRPGAPCETAAGTVPEALTVTEAGLSFGLQLGRSQNSGLFLDMAAGRRWVREHSQGRRVLNLFAYTCAFSVAALAGGARQVVNLDMSKGALSRGRENHRLNGQSMAGVTFLPYDLFRSWGKVRKLGPYGLVIIDPPSFQRGSFVATKDYQRVLRRLPELVEEGSELLVCLNDPAIGTGFLRESMAEHCPGARYQERIANPASFPEREPERGLKVLRFRYSPTSSQ